MAFESTEIPLPYVHVLDIEKVGYIKPHVDSVRVSYCFITTNNAFKEEIN